MAELAKCPEHYIFGLDIGTRSIVGTVGYREDEKNFRVLKQVVRMHETRAMLDGQIHDIAKVAETIEQARRELEDFLHIKLEKVCIAAAGRVLQTITVRVDYDLGEERIVDEECIHNLELAGMEQAYTTLKKEYNKEVSMYCVGSSVIHFYLDDFIMLNLEGHKGRKISADFLATFLPDEVIESLYAAVEKAGLTVANLTLEPIAASELAIPANFRLLNIALVDVGAGTSDISITKDGSIIGYGMIPTAGDAFTEEIAKKYLVDFAGAEEIKMACFSGKVVRFKDIMGISHKVPADEILDGLQNTIEDTTKRVADRIIELNGGSAVSAVFIVGGGGKIPNFSESLAKHLGLPGERVAVRGKEVFEHIHFEQEDIKLDSTLVTPIGICLTFLDKNSSFIFVSVNGRQIKLYDNNRLTVMDAALQIGFPKENLFPKRGKELRYTVNHETRMLRGETGEGAKITVNGKEASFNAKIEADDIIEIIPSTAGEPAACVIEELAEYKRKGDLCLTVNGKTVVCPKMVKVNGETSVPTQSLQDGDQIEILDYYKMEDVLEVMDMPFPEYFFLNGKEGDWEDRIYDEFIVECVWNDVSTEKAQEDLKVESPKESETVSSEVTPPAVEGTSQESNEEEGNAVTTTEEMVQAPAGIHDLEISVNGTAVTLSGRDSYIFVHILDFYPFDTRVPGKTLVMEVDGVAADFMTPLKEGNQVSLYWKD